MLEAVRSWVDHLLVGILDARRRETVSCIVAGIVHSRSVIPATIGREMPGDTADKHKIKRVDRFLGNCAVEAREISRALLRNYNFQPGQRVLLSLDWTAVGNFEMLTTSVVLGGRAVPFHWTVIDKKKTRMAVAERWHVDELKAMLPEGIQFICLFDAGFDAVEFIRHLEKLGLHFVVRSSTEVCIRPQGKNWIRMRDFTWSRGHAHEFGIVEFTKDHCHRVRVVGVHDLGQQQPWLLVTNLQDSPRQVISYYGRRFETEETYKDFKDIRDGLQLKGKRIKSADRLSRLIAAEVIAYWLMVMAGLYGEELGLHLKMQANTIKHRRVLALWRVGRKLLRDGLIQSQHLLHYLWATLGALSAKFGGAKCQLSG